MPRKMNSFGSFKNWCYKIRLERLPQEASINPQNLLFQGRKGEVHNPLSSEEQRDQENE